MEDGRPPPLAIARSRESQYDDDDDERAPPPFTIVRPLGNSSAFLGKTASNSPIVIKLLPPSDSASAHFECTALRRLWDAGGHPSIVGRPADTRLREPFLSADRTTFLFLEWCAGGDLYDAVARSGGGLQEGVAAAWFKQVLEGVAFCHEHGIAHGDIKAENVLLRDAATATAATEGGGIGGGGGGSTHGDSSGGRGGGDSARPSSARALCVSPPPRSSLSRVSSHPLLTRVASFSGTPPVGGSPTHALPSRGLVHTALLCDFGASSVSEHRPRDPCTPTYAPPEVLARLKGGALSPVPEVGAAANTAAARKLAEQLREVPRRPAHDDFYLTVEYACRADMWSIGVLLHYMLTSKLPFPTGARVSDSAFASLVTGDWRPPEGLSDDAKRLLCTLLRVTPSHRATAASALQSSWVRRPPPLQGVVWKEERTSNGGERLSVCGNEGLLADAYEALQGVVEALGGEKVGSRFEWHGPGGGGVVIAGGATSPSKALLASATLWGRSDDASPAHLRNAFDAEFSTRTFLRAQRSESAANRRLWGVFSSSLREGFTPGGSSGGGAVSLVVTPAPSSAASPPLRRAGGVVVTPSTAEEEEREIALRREFNRKIAVAKREMRREGGQGAIPPGVHFFGVRQVSGGGLQLCAQGGGEGGRLEDVVAEMVRRMAEA